MKVFVTGVAGQLGHDVVNELDRRGHTCIGSDIAPVYAGVQDGSAAARAEYASLDITNAAAVLAAIRSARPDAVVHCAAWTQVDAAEEAKNMPIVRAVNADGTKNIASACAEIGCKLLYLSTDYVFDGQGTAPWKPDDTHFAPLNVYGETKLAGERAVAERMEKYFIVRIAWVFGKNGNNFVKTMLRLGRTHDQIRVVNDQVGTPTYTFDLARLLADMIETEKYGFYHATNEGGYISWYDFACEIMRQGGCECRVVPVTTAEYGASKAARPFNSRLDKSKLIQMGFTPLPDWRDALSRYLRELQSEGAV